MSRNEQVTQAFADIDSFDPGKFVAHLTPNATFRFGNAQPISGRETIKDGVSGFFTTIAGLKHNLLNVWDTGDATIVKTEVDYTRHDGQVVSVPNVDILHFDDDLISDWQIYIDLTPVFA